MANSGIYGVNDIRYLMDNQQWKSVGELQLIETQIANSVSAVDFLNIKENEYDVHFMTMTNVQSSGDNVEVTQVQLYQNGTLYTGTTYEFARQNQTASANNESYTTTADEFQLCGGNGNGTNEKGYAYIYFYNLGDSIKYPALSWSAGMWSSDPYLFTTFGSGLLAQSDIVDGIRIRAASGNIATGTFSLYGIRYS